ncbi:hypothetical protein C5B96_04925 [Subtercola sp. Z020]|uniref:Ltp family lipoprotein n=1 Tax=Subtercola sp. Z020 TaxID=2080582 RepID=UPI000CE742A9|nr:Ltp family lipoprotein [Subtercola sp. Z020]PPF86257.1 hypothetical protein C5B96_04925 [Subtercola sp. Z020]
MSDAPQVPAGWYADATDASRIRYWDGRAWTEHTAPVPGGAAPVPGAAPLPGGAAPLPVAEAAARRGVPASTWIVGGVLLVVLLIALITGFGRFLLVLGLIALATGAYVLITRKRSWALLPTTRGAGGAVLAAGLVVAVIGGVVSGASGQPSTPRQASAVVTASAAPAAAAASTAPTAPATPLPTSTPTAAPAPTTAVVPNLVGMKGDQAKAALEALGLNVNWSEAVIIAKNWTVDAQVPAAGTSAVLGAKILLTVSKPGAAAEPATPASAAPAPAAPAVSAEFLSALNKAGSYSANLHMSKAGIYDQLTSEYGEQFSADAAQYAVDNVKADWNANALAKAKDYQESMSMSPEAIRDQLTSDFGEQFTADEADYAIQHLND